MGIAGGSCDPLRGLRATGANAERRARLQLLSSPSQAVDLAAIPLRGPTGSTVTNHICWSLHFRWRGRGEIFIKQCGLTRAAASSGEGRDPVDLFKPVQSNAYDIADAYGLRGFRRCIVHAHVTCLHRGGRLTARFGETYCPYPRIHSNWHGSSIVRVIQRALCLLTRSAQE